MKADHRFPLWVPFIIPLVFALGNSRNPSIAEMTEADRTHVIPTDKPSNLANLSVEELYEKGNNYLAKCDYEEALTAYERAIALDKETLPYLVGERLCTTKTSAIWRSSRSLWTCRRNRWEQL